VNPEKPVKQKRLRGKVEQNLIIRERQLKVADLIKKGFNQPEIARQLGVSQQLISNDMKAVEKLWLERTNLAIIQQRALEVAKIDKMEAEAWEAWDKSKQPAIVEEVEYDGGTGEPVKTGRKVRPASSLPGKKKVRKTYRVGDPKFLDIIEHCVRLRIQIFRLDQDADEGGNIFDAKIPVVPVIVTSREELAEVISFAQFKGAVDGKVVNDRS
jgi:DNA-binding CsgD family transcriptional regulator